MFSKHRKASKKTVKGFHYETLVLKVKLHKMKTMFIIMPYFGVLI